MDLAAVAHQTLARGPVMAWTFARWRCREDIEVSGHELRTRGLWESVHVKFCNRPIYYLGRCLSIRKPETSVHCINSSPS
jgi:hypothetical protein